MARPPLAEVRAILVDPSRRLTPIPSRAYSIAGMPSMKPRARWPIFAAALAAAIGLGVLTWKLVGTHSQPSAAPAAAVAPVETKPAEAPPPPAPPPPVQRGTLEVKVSGAKDSAILVDGEEWGRGASLKVELDPGQHEVTVRPNGRAPITQQVEINGGAVNSIAIVVPRVIKVPTKAGLAPATKRSGDDELLAPKRNR
jgi:hypothetical protein